MNYTTLFEVNTKKIRKVIDDRHIDMQTMSLELGHDRSYIHKIMERRTMKKTDILLFKSLYGVDIEMKGNKPGSFRNEGEDDTAINISINEEKLGKAIGESLGETLINSLDYEAIENVLYRTIHIAAYQAMKAALNDEEPEHTLPKRKLER